MLKSSCKTVILAIPLHYLLDCIMKNIQLVSIMIIQIVIKPSFSCMVHTGNSRNTINDGRFRFRIVPGTNGKPILVPIQNSRSGTPGNTMAQKEQNVLIRNSNGWSGQNPMQFNFGAQVTSRFNLGNNWNLASLKGINSQSMNLSKLSAETIPTAATTTSSSSPSTTSGTEVTLVQHREKVDSFDKGTYVFYWKHITWSSAEGRVKEGQYCGSVPPINWRSGFESGFCC